MKVLFRVAIAYMPTVRVLAGQSRLFQIYQQQSPAKTPKRAKSPNFLCYPFI